MYVCDDIQCVGGVCSVCWMICPCVGGECVCV